MSTNRPSAAPGLYAKLSAGAPGRVTKKLDATPRLADAWTWAEGPGGTVTIKSDTGETVTLTPAGGAVRDLPDLKCSCLLQPRCLHLLAVIAILPIAEGEQAPAAPAAAAEPEEVVPAEPLSPERRAAALQAFKAGAELLAGGAQAAGVVVQGELLRAVHSCKVARLDRLGKAGVELANQVRSLREQSPSFKLGALNANLAAFLTSAARVGLAPETATTADLAAHIGTGRRAYAQLGHLRLHGLFTDPVISAKGYSGVSTYLADQKGHLFTLADVKPPDPERPGDNSPLARYGGGTKLGAVSISHQELGRDGLFMQGATAAENGRLGAGKDVQAARAGRSSWTDPAVQALFSAPLAAQLDRAFASLADFDEDRPAGQDLFFLQGVVLGTDRQALLVKVDPGKDQDPVVVRLLVATESEDLPFRENLRMLARAPGLSLRLIARLVPAQPRAAMLLAFGPGPTLPAEAGAPPAPELKLPEDWAGRCNAGLDRLQRGHLSLAAQEPVLVEMAVRTQADPFVPLRRRLQRLTLGGRTTLPPEATAEVEREAQALHKRLLPTGGTLLRALQEAAHRRDRGQPSHQALAAAFTAAAAYEQAATVALWRSAWTA